MVVLFLSYWGITDPLTVATVFPHLSILSQMQEIRKIILVTIERKAELKEELSYIPSDKEKIEFHPLFSRSSQAVLLNKIDDFVRFPRVLTVLVEKYSVKAIIARGAPAGALAYLVWRKLHIPFLVESFEPHADYMLESGVWRWYDPRFIAEKYWESKQKQTAVGLMPVADNYRRKLIKEKVSAARIVTVPCSVDMNNFQFSEQERQVMRQQLNIPSDAIVGIYVGKFGGMYYEEEAFMLFQQSSIFFGQSFRLIILTPAPKEQVYSYLAKVSFDVKRVVVATVLPSEVPAYLAAADFAYATYKKGNAKQFLSPIKVGEYWSVGLPVLLTDGVGDDSKIICQQGGGAVFDVAEPATVSAAFTQIAKILRSPSSRVEIRELARRYRTIDHARLAYEQLLLPLSKI
jgi:glycosyltransferase involved in cell wall biosynthesis